jgi:proline iminopeptidase
MKEILIEGPGGELWAGVFGEERPGIPLLVIHGGPGFLSLTEEVSELSRRRPVYFYDQLGCGRSSRPADPGDYTVEYYVRELAAVREILGLTEVHLLGHSWGAMLAAEYLLRENPDGVRSLVLAGPLLSAPRWAADQRRHLARMPREVRRAVRTAEKTGDYGPDYQEAMMTYYRKHVCRLDPWPGYLLEAFGRMNLEIYGRMWGESEFTVTGTLKDADLTGRLGEIPIPVLLVCGEHDEAPPETVSEFRDRFPDSSLAVIPGASHTPMLEKPESFRAAVNTFLKAVEAPRPR